ncbi:MAG: RnfABCDGE type electron transport complex subunit G [Bacteroidales bacterium]|jgi:electron transport complex protein RnfG|nr:RnfABCDGE type electron transport complex subunit G [Bacteroidales bacterium]
MAKTESSFKNMVISLTLISLVASAGLGSIYEFTKGPIEQSNLKKKVEAIKQVVPEFNNDPYSEMLRVPTGEGDSLDVYPAKMNDNIVGYAINTYTANGFSGDILLMAGFNVNGSIYNIAVLEHKETPGLGTKMNEPFFKDQFKDKNPSETVMKVKKDGGQIDAITSATISSRAFCDAIQRAYNTLEKGGLK